MTAAEPASEAGIVLMPHTHWDREWYEPFQVFRFKLVDVLDDVIARTEADADFRFTLDGQTAAIEDYLEVRPENAERVRRAVTAGQLAIGPWQILLDEFLCSGETIVRNLELGTRGAERLGGAMPVGYLPDMFGHVAQMPQILARAGIGHACLWRGVPAGVTGHAFGWRGPDGSQVRVEYLFDGYGSALDMLAVPENIPQNMRAYRDATRVRFGDDPVLGMVGTDHLAPHPELMTWVRRNHSEEFPLLVETLGEYVERFDGESAGTIVDGELRSHARGNILPGVLSIRRPLKQWMAKAERTLAEAERLAVRSDRDVAAYLEFAWRRVIESTAHDSVVGSGTDETVMQVQSRLEEAAQLARAVRDGILTDLAAHVPSDGYLVANTLPTSRAHLVELDVPAADEQAGVVATLADGSPLPVQQLTELPTVLGDEVLSSDDAADRILHRIHGRELFGQQIDGYGFGDRTLRFDVAEVPETPVFDVVAFESELRNAISARPGDWRVQTIAQRRVRALVEVPTAPLGETAFRIGQGEASPAAGRAVHAAGRTLENGIVSVTVADDGTFCLVGADGTRLEGLGRIVDGGDRGDSYNYAPPAHDALVERPNDVAVELREAGPLRAAIAVRRSYDIPVGLSDDPDHRAAATRQTVVETVIELRAGEPMVHVHVEFVNVARDHRLRFHLPLPETVDGSRSSGQFAVTERGLTGEGGWGEFPLPTYPAYEFASAGPATVLVRHATEYEVVDGRELALTLLRAVGSISVNVHPLRDEPAASVIPIPGAQELGTTITADFAILAHAGGYRGADAVAWSERFRSDPLVVRGAAPRETALPEPTSRFSLEGESVVLASLRPVDGATELRLVCMSDEPRQARVTGAFGSVTTTDLLGRTLGHEAVDGAWQAGLGPWEIRTLRLAR